MTPEKEKDAVLNCLYWHSQPAGEYCISFKFICAETGLTRETVQKICRRFAHEKMAEFWRGLMNEDGELAGSGYCISEAGKDLLDAKFAKGMVK